MTQPSAAGNEGSLNPPARPRPTVAHFASASSAIFLLIATFGIAAPSPAYAVPKWTPFQDAIASSETIAIVRLVELPPEVDRNVPQRSTKATLDVLQVLKGNLNLGEQEILFAEYPSGAPGEFVAFLDKNRVWRFTARPLTGKKVESNVLGMEGFNDHNAHFVVPGLITLAQLKTYLRNGTLRYSIEGPIWFPQRLNPAWKASGIRIKLTYDAVTMEGRVTGLPTGFSAKPETVRIEYFHRADRRLVSLECRNDRPLDFLGRVDSLDPKSGSLLARFVVTKPAVLNADSLQKNYLADKRLGYRFHKLRLHCARSRQYPKLTDHMLTLNSEIGTIGTLDGWDGGPLEIMRSDYAGPRDQQDSIGPEVPAAVIEKAFAEDLVFRILAQTKTNQYLLLVFDMGKPLDDPGNFQWAFKDDLLYHVYSAPVRGTLQLYDGKTWHQVTTFTVDLDPVAFGPPP